MKKYVIGEVYLKSAYNLVEFLAHGYQIHLEIENDKITAWLVNDFAVIKIGEATLKTNINASKHIIDVILPINYSDLSVIVYGYEE